MIIKSLEIRNFRNYDNQIINFDEKTNIIFGNNAQGKTNILEALYISSTTKSHRGSKDKDIIKFNSDEAYIKVIIEKNSVNHVIEILLSRENNKKIFIDKIKVKRADEILGLLNIILFSPEDLGLIKNGPNERRRFMDIELCVSDKIYLYDLSEYNKILNNRNKLLKELYFNPTYEDMLEVWDKQLIDYGIKIIKKRKIFIDEINEIIKEIHFNISGKNESLYLNYDKNVDENEFEYKLKKNIETDKKNKTTSVGPHRDDIGFFSKKLNLNDDYIDLRKFGSQGQQRTAALSLKLAELELMKNKINDYPVLLLDDVLSELDKDRQKKLVDNIKHLQTVITCTGVEDFINTGLFINNLINVDNGELCYIKKEID